MEAAREGPSFLTKVIVVAVAFGATGLLMALTSRAAPQGEVVVTSQWWTVEWANSYLGSGYTLGAINGGTCHTAAPGPPSSYAPGSSFSCYLITSVDPQQDRARNVTIFPIIVGVTADAPFTAEGSPHFGLSCAMCQVYGVTIQVPWTPGSYTFRGIVEFGWCETAGCWS